MINIFITILLLGVLMTFFKLFGKFGVNNLQAIVVNYFTAGLLGIWVMDIDINVSQIANSNWISHAVVIGLLFITTFNALAFSTQKVGMAISTIAFRMSLIIPVTAAVILYDESFYWLDAIAIALAIIGIFLTTTNKGKLSFNKKYILLVLFIFIAQGFVDLIFNDANKQGYTQEGSFFSVLFLIAGILGSIIVFTSLIGKKSKLSAKNLLWGIGLGIPNFGTLYYMDKALTSSGLESSAIFPIVSMGIIVLSALIGLVFFREKLSVTNWAGIGLAMISIALMTFEF